MELGCALMENLIKLFDEELFYNQNLQCPIVFHAMTRFRSLSSREMVESPREKLSRITKETRRQLEERERGRRRVQLLHFRVDGRELLLIDQAWTSKASLVPLFIVFQLLSFLIIRSPTSRLISKPSFHYYHY